MNPLVDAALFLLLKKKVAGAVLFAGLDIPFQT
jgi:hypothetical protein